MGGSTNLKNKLWDKMLLAITEIIITNLLTEIALYQWIYLYYFSTSYLVLLILKLLESKKVQIYFKRLWKGSYKDMHAAFK